MALKNCPHDGSEHVNNINGYWVCKACQRERMRERRKDEPRVGRGNKNSAKQYCPSKHEYTEANTAIYEYKPGLVKRVCRECARINGRVQRLKRYGLTLESYEAVLAGQDYRCKLCRSEFKSSRDENIDHDHACCDRDGSCGKCIRGILCGECNRGLARFKDSLALLRLAVGYLEEYQVR